MDKIQKGGNFLFSSLLFSSLLFSLPFPSPLFSLLLSSPLLSSLFSVFSPLYSSLFSSLVYVFYENIIYSLLSGPLMTYNCIDC
jgi:hypothetical protein